MPASVAQLLLDSRFAPHFTIKLAPAGKEVKPVCGGIREFLTVDPFEAKSDTVKLEAPKGQLSCCS